MCAPYLTIWYYSNDNFGTRESISRLSQLFYENRLAKERRCFHGSFLSIHSQIGNHSTINKRPYSSSRIRSKFINIWNDYLIFRDFFENLIMESDSKRGKANPLCVHYPLCHKEKKMSWLCRFKRICCLCNDYPGLWRLFKCTDVSLGCLYELINDYELDIREWELLVL